MLSRVIRTIKWTRVRCFASTTGAAHRGVFGDLAQVATTEKAAKDRLKVHENRGEDLDTVGGALKMSHKREMTVDQVAEKVRQPMAHELYNEHDYSTSTLTATKSMKLTAAAHLMQTGADKPFGLLMVADQGSIVGKLSDRRLTTAVATLNGNITEARVDDWMTAANAWVTPKTTLSNICQIMLERNVRHLPIIGSLDSEGLKAKTVRGANTIGEFEARMSKMGARAESNLNQLHGVLSIKKVLHNQIGLAYGHQLLENLGLTEPSAKDLYFRSYAHQWEIHPPAFWIVDINSSIVKCCKKMQKEDVTLLLVQDGDKLVGKLSERRVASIISKKDGFLVDEKVEDWMTPISVAAHADSKMFDLSKQMGDANVRNLPVFQGENTTLDYDNLAVNDFLGILTVKKLLGGEQAFYTQSRAMMKNL